MIQPLEALLCKAESPLQNLTQVPTLSGVLQTLLLVLIGASGHVMRYVITTVPILDSSYTGWATISVDKLLE